MRKKTLRKLIGVALTATLALTGCGSGSGSTGVLAGGVGAAVDGGGGGAAAAAGGTTGFGLTGGTITGGIGGTGGGTGVTGGGGTTTTTGGTTTGGTTGGSNSFLNVVQASIGAASLTNPTALAFGPVSGTDRTFVLQGFDLGANNGSLGVINQNGPFDPNNGFPVQIVQAAAGSPVTSVLNNPFDVVRDATSLYISVGFGQFGNGAIIKVSNLTETAGVISGTFENLTATSVVPNNPAFLTLVTGLPGGDFVYWTEYTSAAGGGSVRRIRTDGTGTAETIITNLNFPAGIDHDGTRLAVCENAGGGTALGRMLTAPINPTTIPLDGATGVTEVTVNGTEQVINRPFDVNYDGRNGFFFTEGAAIDGPGGGLPGPAAQGVGAVRFIPRGQTVASLIANGLTRCAGIDAVDTNADGVTGVLFSESIESTGTIRRRLVDTANVTIATAATVESGLFTPLGVAIVSESLPSFLACINYTGGQNFGSVRIYGP